MGSWGVGLFSDDLACDVRDDYLAALADGLSADAARDRVLDRYSDALADTDEGPLVWLALAATAWKAGRLDDSTRDHALKIIAGRDGLERWVEAGLGPRREAELQKLAETLRSAQKAPVITKKKRGFASTWAVGELVGYRQETGQWLALHVVGHTDGEVGAFPIVNVLDWTSETAPPTEAELAAAQPILFPPEWDLSLPKKPDLCLMLTRKQERDSFERWGLQRPTQDRGPFETTGISYVGAALFERDLVGKWRSQT